MTYPVIESSRHVAFLVAGEEKAAMFSAIRAGSSHVPAARVTGGRTHLVRRSGGRRQRESDPSRSSADAMRSGIASILDAAPVSPREGTPRS